MIFSRILFAAAVAASLLIGAPVAQADTFRLDYGNVSTSPDTVTITRVPVRKPDGKIVYRDISIKLRLSASGKFLVSSGFPKTVPSFTAVGSKLVAGRYKINQSSNILELIGPSAGPNGREQWTLAGTNNEVQMIFYSGPVKGHPMQDRINAAGISTSPYVFGESSDNGSGTLNVDYFDTGALVSLSPSGVNVQLQSHSKSAASDRKLPYLTILLRKCLSTECR